MSDGVFKTGWIFLLSYFSIRKSFLGIFKTAIEQNFAGNVTQGKINPVYSNY